ncbi:hypothetical protein HWV62_13619 [Athelia sp. TMB]|nr:hypothetical protein HWV62_13619 [Athelia sp. TMB]
MEPPSSMFPVPVVFNTSNASGNAQINNVNGDFITNLNVYTVTPDREKEIYQWLAAPDTSGNYNAAREKHHETTGAWFLEGDEFVHWKETPGSALWINGTPGCGKTIICSTVIESVRQEYKLESGAACVYFFFDSRNAETDQSLHEKMLRSLIRQMSYQWGLWYNSRQTDQSATSQQQTGVPAALVDIYGGGHETPSTAALQLTLQKIIADFDRAYIVIDALDECLDRHKLLAWIGGLVQRNMRQLRILFSSRREQDILQCFQPLESICRVSLAGASTNADIERYVDYMLATVARWNVATRARIKRSLMEGVDGMFRWVAFQIAELLKCRTPRAVDAQLRSLPKDLDGMYERSLSRSANPRELKHLLVWLAFSMRPLQVEEFAEVVTIDFLSQDIPTYDPNLRYFISTDVLDLCAGFVTFIPNDKDGFHPDDEEVYTGDEDGFYIPDYETFNSQANDLGSVKLAHMSVKDFLISDRIKAGAATFFGINAILAHSMIAATCLAYLLHLGSHSFLDKATPEHFLPLVSYVILNWVKHVERGHHKEFTPLWPLMIRMFSRGHDALTKCFHLKPAHRYPDWGNRGGVISLESRYYLRSLGGDGFSQTVEEIKSTPPLYYASLLGMQEVVKEILSRGEDVQVRGGPCDNALQAASYHGHEEVVRILLEHGAHVNTHGGKYSNALRAAFHGGHINVVRLLLEHDADVTVREEHEGTLLQEAARHDDLAIVQLLLEHGVDANAPAGPKGTALQIASGGGEIDIVRLLLEHGADANAPAGPEGTALEAVISWADPDKLRRKCELGNRYRLGLPGTNASPALEASRRGCAIVRLLLERGADVNAPAGPKGTALQIASGCDEIDIVRLLLEHGADANAPAGPEGTALQAVISWAHPDKLRREYEFHNPFSTGIDEPDFTSLVLEASRCACAIVQLLVEHGAHVNAPAGPDGTVLQVAVHEGYLNIVQLLLEHGADVNAPAGPDGTALQVASITRRSAEHDEIVQLLIENGADVNAPGGPNATALLHASTRGDEDGVRLMLERGAVMGPQEAEEFIFRKYKTKNQAEILQLLLDSEAGVDKEWLYRKRVEWAREGRIKAKHYDSIELWDEDSCEVSEDESEGNNSEASEDESEGDSDSNWHTPDEGSAPTSPL